MTNRFLTAKGYAQRLASRGDVAPAMRAEHVIANDGDLRLID